MTEEQLPIYLQRDDDLRPPRDSLEGIDVLAIFGWKSSHAAPTAQEVNGRSKMLVRIQQQFHSLPPSQIDVIPTLQMA